VLLGIVAKPAKHVADRCDRSAYPRTVKNLRAAIAGLMFALIGATVVSAQAPSASPFPTPSIPSTLAAAAPADFVPFVPVRRFWSTGRDISLADVTAAIEGRSETFKRVVAASNDASVLWASLGVEPASTTRTVETMRQVKQALDRSGKTLGLVPAARIRPDLRALSVDGLALYGGDRLDDVSAWPLLGADAGEPNPFEPGQVWTMIAGGDVMLDREPYRQSMILGKGVDFVWDGGMAEITARTCCTVDGGPDITTERVAGSRGAVRELLSSADLAVVNHEAPAPNEHSYHPSGLVFTVDPAMLEGLADAGIDAVSLANNHIRNAGSKGVTQTLRNVRKAGLRSFGAGADDERARRPLCFEQGEARTRVCLLGYNDINTGVHSVTDARAGAAKLDLRQARRDIRQLRRDGADVIVVWPHWGREYVTTTQAQQRRWAREAIRAGADVVLGNHSHVVGPIEFVDGDPVFYSLGDLVFDLPRFEATEEGVLVELTFQGSRLLQVELHPTVVHRRAQLNLLERDGAGDVVIKRMREASKPFE
jgi:poly-gamma-glutamate capsule biosynthesis protein CapA/YwtB (metallophosphatase superfamily)